MTGHIRRRGERSWEIRYSLGTDERTGKRKTVTATVKGTKAEAERELRRRLHSKDEGLHVDPSRVTVGEFIEKWLTDWAASNVSPKTSERYGELLRKHVKSNIGAVLMQKLRPVHLVELYGKLLRKPDADEGIGARTVGHVHRVTHRMLGHAVQWSVTQTNPAANASPPPVEDVEIQILAPEQSRATLKALEGRPLFPIVSTALGTGMRRGELLALRWMDMDLDRGQIRVARSLEQTHGKKKLRFKETKTKKGKRSIALPAYLAADLRAHWKVAQELRLALGLGKAPPAGLVFCLPNGEPRAPNDLTKAWAQFSADKGLGVTFHALRHTHASQLIASGMDILTISRRLGHSSPAITLRIYGHLFPDSDDKAARALEAAFSSRTE